MVPANAPNEPPARELTANTKRSSICFVPRIPKTQKIKPAIIVERKM